MYIKKILNKNYLLLVIVFLFYLLISSFYWLPPISDFNNHLIDAAGGWGGNGLYLWVLQWWPFSLSHGINPFIENYTLYPDTQNLAWCTVDLIFPSIFLWPITAMFGPIVSYNIIAMFSPVISAFSMFLLVKHITNNNLSSFIGGYLFGFSSYVIGQLIGHPHLHIIFSLPIIVLISLLYMEKKIKNTKFVICYSLILAIQFTTGLELYAMTTFFGFVTIFFSFIIFEEQRKSLLNLMKLIAYSYVISSIILMPFIYYLLKGINEIPKSFNPASHYSTDLLNYIIPTQTTYLGGNALSRISSTFGGPAENGAYLGIPLLTILFIYFVKTWERKLTKLFFTMFVVILVCSLGPILHIEGIPLMAAPWALVKFIPFINQALPMRFPMFLFFISAIVTGLYIQEYNKLKYVYVLLLLTILFLLPNLDNIYLWRSKALTAQFFSNDTYKKFIKKNDNLLILPYLYRGPGTYFQAIDKYYFKLNDGFIGYNPKQIFDWPLLVQTFYHSVKNPLPGFSEDFMCYLNHNLVDEVVIYGKQEQNIYDKFLINFKTKTIGRVKIYYIKEGVREKNKNCSPTSLTTVVNLLSKQHLTSP